MIIRQRDALSLRGMLSGSRCLSPLSISPSDLRDQEEKRSASDQASFPPIVASISISALLWFYDPMRCLVAHADPIRPWPFYGFRGHDEQIIGVIMVVRRDCLPPFLMHDLLPAPPLPFLLT